MAIKLTDIAGREDRLAPGHRLCPGCAEPIIIRQLLQAIDGPVVMGSATGCLEIGTTPFPYTSWRVPWIHSAFENVATTVAGAEAMYRSLIRQGKMEDKGITFVAVGGDGATYDIGLQWISGVWERGHRIIYLCLNNEAYMNTGIQRSSATPLGAWTTTTPVGSVQPGKQGWRKDMMAIAAAHNIPYAAQASPHNWRDLMTKVQKAAAADGPSFINVLSSCDRGWRHDTDQTIVVSRIAFDTCVWPLFEIENGKWTLNHKPRDKKPIIEWLKTQGRFSHLLRPQNAGIVEQFQREVDAEWERLLARCAS